MEKPELKISLHQISPALPDPYHFSEKIIESIRYINANSQATVLDVTPDLIELLSIEEQELEAIKSHINGLGALYLNPTAVSSLILFSHIYLTYYRQEDFADLENYLNVYEKFNKLMNLIKGIDRKRIAPPSMKVFDLESIDDAIDLLLSGK